MKKISLVCFILLLCCGCSGFSKKPEIKPSIVIDKSVIYEYDEFLAKPDFLNAIDEFMLQLKWSFK